MGGGGEREKCGERRKGGKEKGGGSRSRHVEWECSYAHTTQIHIHTRAHTCAHRLLSHLVAWAYSREIHQRTCTAIGMPREMHMSGRTHVGQDLKGFRGLDL